MARPRTVMSLVAVVALVGAAPASAANRYASPSGTGVDPCSSSNPATACPIETAVNDAISGDEVTLLAGPYSTNNQLTLAAGVTAHGTTGAAPVISSTATFAFGLGAGSILRDVDIEQSNSNGAAFYASGAGSVLERVYAHSTQAPIACEAGPGSLLRDVVCWHTGSANTDSAALKPYNNGSTTTVTLRNVTAVSTVAPGVLVQSSGNTMNLTGSNVIAKGTTADVGTQNLGGSISAVFDHSNYATESDPDSVITDPGTGTGNVTVAPGFVNSATGNFHETALSTGTIDRGTSTGVLSGELDVDGKARSQGAAPDIGAYEIAPPQPPTGVTPPPGVTPPTGVTPPPGVTPNPATPTGRRTAALKKCKKKHSAKKRKKCKKKAKRLPV